MTTGTFRKFLAAFIITTIPLAALGQSGRPNILLVISDDIGTDMSSDIYPDLIDDLTEQYGPSGHNHPDYALIDGSPASTPTLEALAQAGTSFTHVWAQPYCSPTRASLLSGLFAAKTGVLDYLDALSQNHHSFVADLKEKGGYSTAVFGKWHIAGLTEYFGMKPKEAGFELFQGNLHGGLDTYFEYNYHVQDNTTPADEWLTEEAPVRSLPGIAPTTFAPVVKTADAIDWITEQEEQNPDKPWFAWFAFNLSHITAVQEPNPMAVPDIDTLDEVSRAEMEACGGQFGSAHVGDCSSEALMRAMTNAMDTMLGRLIDTVDALDSNTYIIYIGDNGTWMFGPGREFIDNMYITRRGRSKGTAYESGVRVPMIIRGPGVEAGAIRNEPVDTVDMYATILDLAGLEIPETVPNMNGDGEVVLDSVSVMPVVFDETKTARDPDTGYLLAETVNPLQDELRQAAVRNATHKIICNESANTENCLFYSLADDPLEEYPLDKPESCSDYENGNWTPAAEQWHFCRLLEVMATESFLSTH